MGGGGRGLHPEVPRTTVMVFRWKGEAIPSRGLRGQARILIQQPRHRAEARREPKRLKARATFSELYLDTPRLRVAADVVRPFNDLETRSNPNCQLQSRTSVKNNPTMWGGLSCSKGEDTAGPWERSHESLDGRVLQTFTTVRTSVQEQLTGNGFGENSASEPRSPSCTHDS